MKKILLLTSISAFVSITSCNSGTEKKDSHIHDDGSTHTNHDTIKPVQQEFNVADTVKKDTTTHTHAGGEKHAH